MLYLIICFDLTQSKWAIILQCYKPQKGIQKIPFYLNNLFSHLLALGRAQKNAQNPHDS